MASRSIPLTPDEARTKHAPFVGRNYFYQLIKDGQIESFRVTPRKIMTTQSAVEQWIERSRSKSNEKAVA